MELEGALSVSVNTSSSTPQKGEQFTLTCIATKSSLLENSPTVDWYDGMGNRIVSSATDGIIVDILLVSGLEFKRSIVFSSLDISHSREYRCNAIIHTVAPPYIITKEATWNVLVSSMIVTLMDTQQCS